MQTYETADDLEAALHHLVKIEPRFKPVWQKAGTPSLRKAPADFEGLLKIIVEQFLSLSAADAIWLRIVKAYDPITPERIKRASPAKLLSLGLSNAKVKSFKGIAAACLKGSCDLAVIHQSNNDDVMKTLIKLPGVGPWTAEIFLLSNLSRADVFPAGDLALQAAAQSLLGLDARPSAKEVAVIAQAWQPHRAAAARLLWAHYRLMKQMPQA